MTNSVPEILRKNREAISACDMGGCASLYKINIWKKRFFGDRIYQGVLDRYCPNGYEGRINRQDIFAMVDAMGKEYDENKNKQVFFAVMLWGSSKGEKGGRGDGRGPWRTEHMVSTGHYLQTIKNAYLKVQEDDIPEAYKQFADKDTKLKKCGPSFLTKYLYFIGRGCSTKPLTLDAVMARKLEEICELNIRDYARVSREKKKGRINGIANPYLEGYMNYIEDMNAWAKELEVKSEQIEYFLFYPLLKPPAS